MANLLDIVTLHGITRSPALEEDVRSRAEKLRELHQAIMGCRVVIERSHGREGGQFVVRLRVSAPGADVVINHNHAEDVHVALRDAFDAARRQFDDHFARRGGRGKSHQAARSAGRRGKAYAKD